MSAFGDAVGTQAYTPIVIQFNPWMLADDDSAITHSAEVKYRLRITAPRSNRRGDSQYIADSIIVPVPADGLVRFKLLPSDRYLPIGRYIVEYFRSGCSTPLDTQEWMVPSVPRLNTYSFVLGENDPVLPLKIWRILSVTPGDNWVAEHNALTWRFERPLAGTMVKLDYAPAATLDTLLDYKINKLEQVERPRK